MDALAGGKLKRDEPAPHVTRLTLDNPAKRNALDRETLEALAALRPVFDKRYGTVTAGNASPLTDGGSAVLLMSDDKARALGIPIIDEAEFERMAGVE